MMDFDTFLDAARAILISGTLPTLNLPTKKPSFIRVVAFFLMNISVKLS